MENILLDLGTQPLVGNLSNNREDSLKAEQYPLKAIYNDDLQINLEIEIEPKLMYENYWYHSGVSKPYIRHCEEIYNSLNGIESNTIIDIGGNDGTLLKTFKKMAERDSDSSKLEKRRYINVDASKSFESINSKAGIEYIQGYFSEGMDLPKADIITSTNVFQHTKDIHSFLKGIVKHLEGVWVLEFPYTYNTLKTLQFDQFYHEHYYYWLVTPLEKLFSSYGLKIIKISESDIHGGSIRIWSTKKEHSANKTDLIEDYKNKERSLKLDLFEYEIFEYLESAKNYIYNLAGKTAFFGAAAKGCVFLNALNINSNSFPDSYIIDDTQAKQGLFFPGTGFAISSRKRLIQDEVQNIIILPHNFGAHIAKSLRYNQQGNNDFFRGDIITMLPKITNH